jgi:hypothetical protein
MRGFGGQQEEEGWQMRGAYGFGDGSICVLCKLCKFRVQSFVESMIFSPVCRGPYPTPGQDLTWRAEEFVLKFEIAHALLY